MPSDDDEKGDVYPVLGHSCAGLTKHLEAATYGCIPRITGNGIISGCDDHNPVLIEWCPYCGNKLADAK